MVTVDNSKLLITQAGKVGKMIIIPRYNSHIIYIFSVYYVSARRKNYYQ
jgi:hypothetical protein